MNINIIIIFSLQVFFRFAFPKAKGAQWNIFLLTFIPICSGLVPYLYVIEATSRSRSIIKSFLF